eukprot:8958902-Alexandrium_andersonii.AAC.1
MMCESPGSCQPTAQRRTISNKAGGCNAMLRLSAQPSTKETSSVVPSLPPPPYYLGAARGCAAVSYTHLTLPTICSV